MGIGDNISHLRHDHNFIYAEIRIYNTLSTYFTIVYPAHSIQYNEQNRLNQNVHMHAQRIHQHRIRWIFNGNSALYDGILVEFKFSLAYNLIQFTQHQQIKWPICCFCCYCWCNAKSKMNARVMSHDRQFSVSISSSRKFIGLCCCCFCYFIINFCLLHCGKTAVCVWYSAPSLYATWFCTDVR